MENRKGKDTRRIMENAQEDKAEGGEQDNMREGEMENIREEETPIKILTKEIKERGMSHSVTGGYKARWKNPLQKGRSVHRSPSGKRRRTEEKEQMERKEGKEEMMCVLSDIMEHLRSQAKDMKELREEIKEIKLTVKGERS